MKRSGVPSPTSYQTNHHHDRTLSFKKQAAYAVVVCRNSDPLFPRKRKCDSAAANNSKLLRASQRNSGDPTTWCPGRATSSSQQQQQQQQKTSPPITHRRKVRFNEMLTILPRSEKLILTPSLIEQLWYSHEELDSCKAQVRKDFWHYQKLDKLYGSCCNNGSTNDAMTACRWWEEDENCLCGMERYFDAVYIGSVQKGLKQALFQAQREQKSSPASSCTELVLAHISRQWSTSCLERSCWYAYCLAREVEALNYYYYSEFGFLDCKRQGTYISPGYCYQDGTDYPDLTPEHMIATRCATSEQQHLPGPQVPMIYCFNDNNSSLYCE